MMKKTCLKHRENIYVAKQNKKRKKDKTYILKVLVMYQVVGYAERIVYVNMNALDVGFGVR